jgi:hypothetical protein
VSGLRSSLALALALAGCGGHGGRLESRPTPAPAPKHQPALPGCTPDVAARLDRRITLLDARVRRRQRPEPAPPIALEAARAELRAIWQDPCLSALARFFAAPEPASRGELDQLFGQRLGDALRSASGARWSKFGERVFVVPPLLPAPLGPEAERAIAPWLCAPDEAACGSRAASYVARAEASFDLAQRERELFNAARPGRDGGCRDLPAGFDEDPPLERWASCVIQGAPWTHRYARRRYRAPERGWLALRGRRGHYEFADEIRVYDLETGSAYAASSTSELVLDGTEVDHDAADRRRKLDVFAGTVVADQVRELAFVLVTLPAVLPARTNATMLLVPPQLGAALSRPEPRGSVPPSLGPSEYGSSNQTEIAFSLVGAEPLARGNFTWPDSWKAAEDHADRLIEVLEAGLQRGCPPAPLPRGIALGANGAVSPIDADPALEAEVFQKLAQALEAQEPCNVHTRR